MRLTVLGGSAAGANSGQGCSGYLVTTEATSLVLDLGPGTFIELRRHVNYRALNAVVISHLHVDHLADLLAMRFALAYNPIRLERRVRLYMPPGGQALLQRLGGAFVSNERANEFFGATFDVSEYDPASPLRIGSLRLRFTPTVHYVPCWAIRVGDTARPDADLTYTADTGPAADLAPFVAGSRVLIAEATHLEAPDMPEAERGHLTAREAGELATATGISTLVLTHLWEEVGFERYQRAAAESFMGRIALARAGLSLEW